MAARGLAPLPKVLDPSGSKDVDQLGRRVYEWSSAAQNLLASLRAQTIQTEKDVAALQAAPASSGAGGDVVGPGSAVDSHVALYDGTTGKLIKDGGALPTGNVVGPGSAVDSHVALYDGTTGKLLKDGGALPTGNVVGPGSAVDSHVALFDGTTGKLIKDGGLLPNTIASAFSVYVPPASPNAADDEVTGGSLAGAWTINDPGGRIAVSIVNSHICVDYTANATTSNAWIYKATPASEFAFIVPVRISGAQDNYSRMGIAVFEDGSNSAKRQSSLFFIPSLGQWFGSEFSAYNGSETGRFGGFGAEATPGFLRIRMNGTTCWYDICADGQSWQNKWTGTLAYTPAHFGLWVNCTASAPATPRAWYKFVRVFTGARSSGMDASYIGRMS